MIYPRSDGQQWFPSALRWLILDSWATTDGPQPSPGDAAGEKERDLRMGVLDVPTATTGGRTVALPVLMKKMASSCNLPSFLVGLFGRLCPVMWGWSGFGYEKPAFWRSQVCWFCLLAEQIIWWVDSNAVGAADHPVLFVVFFVFIGGVFFLNCSLNSANDWVGVSLGSLLSRPSFIVSSVKFLSPVWAGAVLARRSGRRHSAAPLRTSGGSPGPPPGSVHHRS